MRVLLTALGSACCWWIWMAWDHGYQQDPATGQPSGPYQLWQVVGCLLCLGAVTVLAVHRLPVYAVSVAMTAGFTLAWSATASASDDSGLWAVGAVLIAVGMLAGTAVVAGVTSVITRHTGRPPGR